MKESIYLIEENEPIFNYQKIIGYCQSEKEAKDCIKKLYKKVKANNTKYDKWCKHCACKKTLFSYSLDVNAQETLDSIRNGRCPYKNNIRMVSVSNQYEPFCGFEIQCDNMVDGKILTEYVIRKCSKLS